MNSNLAACSRLNQIKLVSRIFRWLIHLGVVCLALLASLALLQAILVCLGGRIFSGEAVSIKLSLSPSQVFALPTDFAAAGDTPVIPWPLVVLCAVQLGLMACGLRALDRLFQLFERGIFFAVENVRHLKALGLVVAGCGLVQTALELSSPQKNLNLNLLLLGLLMVFISWIMDEGRKIQEEQELTV